MIRTIGPAVLFLLHFLAVFVQLLVCQLVKGVRRFRLWWDFGWADWRLMFKKKQKITVLNFGEGNRQMLASRKTQHFTGVSSVITLARTWDCGPAVFMSWRFCCRIWGGTIAKSRFWFIRVRQNGSQERTGSRKRYLVSCLDHLSRVGEKRHKQVWVLNLDGGTAGLCHLFCLQPLSERKSTASSTQSKNTVSTITDGLYSRCNVI